VKDKNAAIALGVLVIVLVAAVPAFIGMALDHYLTLQLTGHVTDHVRRENNTYILIGLLGAAGATVATVALLRGKRKPDLLRGIVALALLGLAGGLLSGLFSLGQRLLESPESALARNVLARYRHGERDFAGINLSEVDLSKASLVRADLRGADLTGADLSYTDLTGADLSNADLTGADLTGAYMPYADLTGADLSNANLNGASLLYAHVTEEQLAQAQSLIDAILPDGRKHY
jgi:hypothetical protein